MAQPEQEFQWGPVEEVWLAPVWDPTNKSKFLVRPEQYSRSGVKTGRNLRLGEPINLGPAGAWRQVSWEGGSGQENWSDEAMYAKATLDTASERGKLKLNSALGDLGLGLTARTNVKRLILGRNAVTPARGDPHPLFIGEYGGTATVPTGGWKVYKKLPGGALTTMGATIFGDYVAFSPVDDASAAFFVGNNIYNGGNAGKGLLATMDVNTGAATLQHLDDGHFAPNSFEFYNGALFWCAGNWVKKRVNPGTGPTYTKLFTANECYFTRGITVWNNRLWFGGVTPSMHSIVYTSDGTQTVEAFKIPDEFEVHQLKAHYGALYICGSKPAADRVGWIGQVWRYTGSQLKLLYEVGNKPNEAGEDHTIWDMETIGNFLVWTAQGRASNNYAAGLMFYDAEVDAISAGPNTYGMYSSNVTTSCIEGYDQTLVTDFREDSNSNIYARPIRKGGAVRIKTGTDVVQWIETSRYDGELPGEEKVWLAGRVRAKFDNVTYNKIVVNAIVDDSSVETHVYDIHPDLPGVWNTYLFAMKDASGHYIKATTLKLKLYLYNTENSNIDTTKNIIVDTVEVEFMPAPHKRRQWQLRVLCNDNQVQLDGAANTLSTTDTLVQRLEDLWAEQEPLQFWDKKPVTRGSGAVATAEVFIQDYNMIQYPIDDDQPDTVAEVSLNLVEIVKS